MSFAIIFFLWADHASYAICVAIDSICDIRVTCARVPCLPCRDVYVRSLGANTVCVSSALLVSRTLRLSDRCSPALCASTSDTWPWHQPFAMTRKCVLCAFLWLLLRLGAMPCRLVMRTLPRYFVVVGDVFSSSCFRRDLRCS